MIRDAIRLVVERKQLTAEQSRSVMLEMMSGTATPSQIASLITAMRMKGETEEELRGFVMAMRENAMRLAAPEGSVDLCGTGGDGLNTFNISTVASFVVAAAGIPVAKHGNRSVSSKSGSADLLSALGVPIDLDPPSVERCIVNTNLGFMFAPVFHRSMKNVLEPRREIGIRTFFNILGPMTNPATVKHQLIGVYDPGLAPLMAGVLKNLGTKNAMIVNGMGMDEITILGKTRVVELKDEAILQYDISPEMFGLDVANPEDILGGDPLENARITMSILRGENSSRSDIVAMNAGAAIYVAGKVESLEEGVAAAFEVMRNGKALVKTRSFCGFAHEMEKERQERAEVRMLRGRKILPAILRSRSGDIAADLLIQLGEIDGGDRYLHVLDRTELLDSPNVLSVLVLSRALNLCKNGIPEMDSAERSTEKLSEAIRSSDGISIIGEYKPSSPSANPLEIPPSPEYVSEIYSSCGITGMSVLVEPDFFHGGPDLFAQVRSLVSLPMLFKDFVIDEDQIAMANCLGADSVLLIAKALTPGALDELASRCIAYGLEPLVELHDDRDLVKLRSCQCYDSIPLIGINSRDLRSLETGLEKVVDLRKKIPRDRIVIAESGVQSPEDIRTLDEFDAVLIGSLLMRSENLKKTVAELVTAGRGSKT